MALTVNIGGDGNLFVGEDKTFKLTVVDSAGVPVDTTGWVVVFDVRKKDTSPDPAIFSKTTTIEGIYSAVLATNTQRRVATLTDTELNTVQAKVYRHSWKRMDDGSETVIARGNFTPEKATAP